MTDLLTLLAAPAAVLATGFALVHLWSGRRRRTADRLGSCKLLDAALRDFPEYRGTEGATAPHLCLLVHTGRRRVLAVSPLGAKEIAFEQIWSVEVETDAACLMALRRRGGLSRSGAGAEALIETAIATVSGPVAAIDLVVRSMDPDFPVMRWSVWAPQGLIRHLEPWQLSAPLRRAEAMLAALRPVFGLAPLPMAAPQRIALRGPEPLGAPPVSSRALQG